MPADTRTRIRVASFNVLGDAAAKANGQERFATRLDRLVAVMRESEASALLLQECISDRIVEIQDKLGPNWIWSRAVARVVLVDKRVWKMGDERVRDLPAPHSGANKRWPLVQLTHRERGDVVWAVSQHFSSTTAYLDHATREQMDDERLLQAAATVEALREYRWVFGGGDLNSASLAAGKPKRLLLNAGFSLLTQDADFDSPTVDSLPNSTPGGQQIDELWVKGGLEIVDGRIIDSGGGSDHRMLVAELAINPRDLTQRGRTR